MTFLVYAHIDPRTELPFYIGKGNLKRAFLFKRNNSFYENVVSKIRSEGFEPKVEILHECETEELAFTKEKLEINFYGRRDLGTGCLVNLTDGGDGVVGSPKSEHFISDLSIRMIGNKFGKGNPKGVKFSEETKSRMRISRAAFVKRQSEFYLNRGQS